MLDTLLISTTLIIQTVNPGSMASWKRNLKQDKDHSGGRRGPFVSRVFFKETPTKNQLRLLFEGVRLHFHHCFQDLVLIKTKICIWLKIK